MGQRNGWDVEGGLKVGGKLSLPVDTQAAVHSVGDRNSHSGSRP